MYFLLISLAFLSKKSSCLNKGFTGSSVNITQSKQQAILVNNSSFQNQNQSIKTVFITGGTGVMGQSTLNEFVKHLDKFKIKLLLLPSRQNRRIIQQYLKKYGEDHFEIVWGDFNHYNDVYKGVENSDYVLHIGGLVSPIADIYPYLTQKTNINAARYIVRSLLEQKRRDTVKVCFIGSVAETGNRNYPVHWGRTGDPIKVSIYDHYGLSKVIAERIFVESGIKSWVVLRQTGILHPKLFSHIDPIMFNTPLNTGIEWVTVEDSGRLMLNLVLKDMKGQLPADFWNKFYNIGSGENYRITNYEFDNLIFKNIGLEAMHESYEPHWISTKNFHGHYFTDSDKLEEILEFRGNIPIEDYFKQMCDKTLFIYRIGKYIPFKKLMRKVVKVMLKHVASEKMLGTIDWINNNMTDRITAFYGSFDEYLRLPRSWSDFKPLIMNTSNEEGSKYRLNHGYDESKPLNQIELADLVSAAKFRGGEVMSNSMKKGDLITKIEWKCGHCGKTFFASPTLILLGGHWCPHCFVPSNSWNYDSIAKTNPFFAQVWYSDHNMNESNVYHFNQVFNESCYHKDPFHPQHIHYQNKFNIKNSLTFLKFKSH